MVSRRANIILLALTAAALGGCGYHSGGDKGSDSGYHWESIYRPGIHSVAIPIFQSTVYERGIEFDVTKAVVTDLEAHTPYKVTNRDHADTILEGEIVGVKVNTISYDFNANVPQEQIV